MPSSAPLPPLGRRTWLLLAASALATACTTSPDRFQGTFLQPWKSYESLSPEEWRRRLRATRALGCDEIVLQWSATEGGAHPWALPEALIAMLFDEAGREGMGIRVGLPYDERWWTVLASRDPGALPAFLAATQARCLQYLAAAPWPRQQGFRGWYLPYELDQYNWATTERRALLVPWLQAIAAGAGSHAPLAVSTFFSKLQTPGTLTALWTDILDKVALRPMLQDGVGVAGMGNYAGLEPLRALLRQRGVPFDLIIELFEQLPPEPGTGDAFRARAATASRVRAQMDVARTYGAERVIAFAIDPWMLGDTPEARQLWQEWQQGR
ncbi:DUF4434 domain-containing protein [Paracidovorax avenae]|uniref:DUF4434 domain-containing protein n=1 Tax=Paracidovorax avenae TaxID=80867 RepID=UPI000D214F56|nr:DUF4434 domain-containing protein [Paracidovorax avenae]AVS85164.1 DUF4434 domain-containing protein [Paracidovorax avenae]